MKYTLVILILILQSCYNHQSENKKQDSILLNDEKKQSVASDCFETFFSANNNELLATKQLIQADGKALPLSDFVKLTYDDSVSKTLYCMKDIDQNGQSELWLRGYTGGAHCCDEWKVFEPQANNQYKLAAQLTAGEVCVQKDTFIYSFNQVLGYFRSCYACGYEDSAKGFLPVREIKLLYKNAKFLVQPLNTIHEQQLLKNLSILKDALLHSKPDDEEMTEQGSMQKEFAMNLAVYYYTHNKDWNAVEKLIAQYYSLQDSKVYTKELKDLLSALNNENSF